MTDDDFKLLNIKYPDFKIKVCTISMSDDKYIHIVKKWKYANIDQSELELGLEEFEDRIMKPVVHLINKALKVC